MHTAELKPAIFEFFLKFCNFFGYYIYLYNSRYVVNAWIYCMAATNAQFAWIFVTISIWITNLPACTVGP